MGMSRERRHYRTGAVAKAVAVWVLLAALAVLNGGVREAVLVPRLGEDPAHLVSTALLVGLILLVAAAFFARTDVGYRRFELVLIGILWTVLTVGFEFLVGYLENTPVETTLGQYNVLAGEVWIAVPITLFFAPLVFGRYLVGRRDQRPA